MNLEQYLLSSRVKSKLGARYLIENGLVSVNGHVIREGTIAADGTDRIDIKDADPGLRLDAPDSYWRGRVIQEQIGLVGLGDTVLHVETRDGGFPMLVRDYSGEPFVITAKNIPVAGKLVGTNPFAVKPGDIQTVTRARVDVMVQELEIDAIKCFQAMEHILPALKARGKLLLFLSSHGRDVSSLKDMASGFLPDMGVDVMETFEYREGIYIYGKRKSL